MHPKRAHHNPSGCIYTVVSVLEGGVDGGVRAFFFGFGGGAGFEMFYVQYSRCYISLMFIS